MLHHSSNWWQMHGRAHKPRIGNGGPSTDYRVTGKTTTHSWSFSRLNRMDALATKFSYAATKERESADTHDIAEECTIDALNPSIAVPPISQVSVVSITSPPDQANNINSSPQHFFAHIPMIL